MNTPFDWARTQLSPSRPMGTIFSLKRLWKTVVRAARTGEREYWVGTSTLMTIVGNMIAPAFMDWYLARTAVQGQETQRLVPPGRPDNLFEPVTDLHRTRVIQRQIQGQGRHLFRRCIAGRHRLLWSRAIFRAWSVRRAKVEGTRRATGQPASSIAIPLKVSISEPQFDNRKPPWEITIASMLAGKSMSIAAAGRAVGESTGRNGAHPARNVTVPAEARGGALRHRLVSHERNPYEVSAMSTNASHRAP